MAKCLKCYKDIKLNIDTFVKPIDCPHCDSGPFRVTRATGYLFAMGLIVYFIFVVVFGVLLLGVDPNEMFIHVHNSGSEGSFAGLMFILGFFIWVKFWTVYWSKKYAKLKG